MPYAHYVWLLNNQQFKDIPPGYVIHHLDFDEENNDISNLALMKKQYHLAYHYKVKVNDENHEKLQLRTPIGLGTDLTVPRVNKLSTKKELWKFRWQETDPTGKRVDRQLTSMGGKAFRTQKEAEKGKTLFMKIHPHFNQDKQRILNLICQINEDIEPEELDDAYQMIKKIFPKL